MHEPRVLCHVGTYADAGGQGLYPLLADASGTYTLGEPFPGAPNASFGAWSPRFGLHYFVDEQSHGLVRVLRREPSGWAQLSQASTQGAEPCYVSLSPGEDWLAAANYGSGSIALFHIDPATGLIAAPTALRANHGRGPVAGRQAGPHAHCAVFSPDGKHLFQTDLGTDQVLSFAFDRDHGVQGAAATAFAAPPGSGPRHLLFHPRRPLAMLLNELASTLTLFDVAGGKLSPRQTISTLPRGFTGESLGGHLAIDAAGTRIYATNRGHDSIAVFALGEAWLALLGHTPSGGASPRHFLLCEDERRLILANQEGGNVAIFAIAADGTLAQCGEVAVPGAAFILATAAN